tara:strand:- start:869 stop:3193 length:2325 start_codon:yes stop_codon:yes gene_type:complete
MSTFSATQNMRVQQHFEVFEIDLPVITGACTLGSSQGFGTPLTCDQAWTNEYKTYYFTNENAPILPSINGEPIYRCITAIKENTTELRPGDGLSARGSLNITFSDFTKQDPNSSAPGVTDAVKNQGTFFGKLNARQIFENKTVRLKLYRVQPDGSIDLVNGAQTRSYIANAFKLNSSSGKWSLECKDLISLANLDEKSWPITSGGFVRLDVNDSVTAIPVDGEVDYSSVDFVRIGDEFFQIISVTNNLSPTAVLNVTTRGGDLYAPVSAVLLTKTVASDHSAGDEVFVCDLSDNETIDSLITKVLVDSDFDSSLIPAAEWAEEVAEWHSTDKINTLHSESESVNDVLNRVLTGYLMDLWFSTTENKAKLSAISVWKQSTATLLEGKEINAYSIKKTPKESIRASRALVIYDKKNLADSDDVPSYKKGSQFADNTLISPALFSKHKDKQFNSNFLLTKDAADLLTQRYVSRFKFTPFVRVFQVEERALNFNAGDVVDLITTTDQGSDGLISGNIRAQILKINPRYQKDGRIYDVATMSYEAAFNSGSEIVLDSPLASVNLYILAGAPSEDVTLTFVLDGSYSSGETAIRAGAFSSGSKIIIVMANGFDAQAIGGSGGKGASVNTSGQTSSPLNGTDGGIVYDAQGIDTDIYFSGATPSAAYPTADGYIRAPGGGEGGFNSITAGPVNISGRGGDGGDGRSAGTGGDSGDISGIDTEKDIAGKNGEIDGSGNGWGVAGANNDATGGLAGSGVKDNGATVNFFGDTPARYINGNGDH